MIGAELSFRVDGVPIAKGRPRFTLKGGVYTPKPTRQWESTIRAHALGCARSRSWSPTSSDTYEVEIVLRLKDRRRRDVDNCAKAILDACNRVLWLDDFQIAELHVRRVMGHPRSGVLVSVKRCAEPFE